MNSVARFVGGLLSWRHRRFVAGGNPFRERRMQLFVKLIDHEGERILDIGYGYGQFENRLAELGLRNRIVALDIVPRDVSQHPNVTAFVVADAAHLPFAAFSVDLVYCNSLLEHVGDWHIQRRVFAEIERVGCKFFVQTPNRHFPIEPHHLLPFFQYLPSSCQRWVGQNILGHYEQVWLLDGQAVRELAGIGDEINVWKEKALGLTKSFVLFRGCPPDRSE